MNGEDEKIGWISEDLGHKNANVTTSIYAKWIETINSDSGNLIGEKFGDGSSVSKRGTELRMLVKK